MDEKTAGNIKINVNKWFRSTLDANVIMYELRVSKKEQEWIIEYRYKQFDELHNGLKKTYSNLPSLPGKSLFKISESSALDERRQKLEQYLQVLLTRPDIVNSEGLKQFLQLDIHASDIIVNPPKQLGQISGFAHGVRDFILEQKSGVLFVLSGDMNVASRVDAYLTNMKMPWDKEDQQTLLPVGALECWIREGDENSYQFERAWSKIYPLQGICLFWDSENNNLYVGLDEGKLNILKVPSDVGYLRYEDTLDDKLHDGRIMGLYHHNLTNTTYSVSEDKTLKSIVNGKVVNVIKESDQGLTALQGDPEYKRLFASNRSGNIFIYDISSGNPVRLNVLTTSMRGAIRGLSVDIISNYLFTGGFDDGELGVFNLEKPGKEKFVTQTASFMGKANVRYIEWSHKRRELFSGCKDGTITIWNASKAQQIYVLKAHQNDITKLQWVENQNTLITSSKEKTIKFYQMPKEWRDKQLEAMEDNEFATEQRQQNIQNAQQRIEAQQNDSDDDDLLGWHKF